MFVEFRPEALLMFVYLLSCLLRLYFGAGYEPGCVMLRIHHAEIFSETEAYGDGFSCFLPVASWPRRDVTKLVSEHGLRFRVSSMV